MQGDQRLLVVGHEDALGDFEHQAARLQSASRAGCRSIMSARLGVENCTGDRLTAILRSPGHCAAWRQASRQRPFAERQDEAAVLGDRDEHGRRNHALDRMVPPRERLEAGHDIAAQIDDRLVVQLELAALDRLAQIHLDLAPVVDLLVHRSARRSDRCRGCRP